MPEGGQEFLGSTNRKERVRITVDVETNGALEKVEPPLVVGVMAPLSGHRPEGELGKLKDDKRKFIDIDRDNIDKVMAGAAPVLNLTVDNTLTNDDSKMRVNLNFNAMSDFEPANVANQIAPLREMLEMRNRLDQIISKINRDSKLNDILAELLASKDKVDQLARELKAENESTQDGEK